MSNTQLPLQKNNTRPQIFLSLPSSFIAESFEDSPNWINLSILSPNVSFQGRQRRMDFPFPLELTRRKKVVEPDLRRKCDSLHTKRPKASDFPRNVAARVIVEAPVRQTALPDPTSTTCLPSVPTPSIPPAWTRALPRHSENYQYLVESVLSVSTYRQNTAQFSCPPFPSPVHTNPGWPVRAKSSSTVTFSRAFWIPATSTLPAKVKRPAQYQADGVLLKFQQSRESLEVVQ